MLKTNRTFVYVDGFNLYYGKLKNSKYKWVNIETLCRLLLPHNEIIQIRYFSAQISARPNDPNQPVRQQTYFRALRTLPSVDIVLGHFLSHEVLMTASPVTNPPKMVKVLKTEEKGSDVNIASYMLMDGFQNRFDTAVLMSNDSDLATPLKFLRETLGKKVGILNPQEKASRVLVKNSDFVKSIRDGVLAVSQFDQTLTDSNGTFTKPIDW